MTKQEIEQRFEEGMRKGAEIEGRKFLAFIGDKQGLDTDYLPNDFRD